MQGFCCTSIIAWFTTPATLARIRRFSGALEGKEIDYAFLPVNEKNFIASITNIIGNMSVREAFHFAEKIGAKRLVPMHYDMFANNRVYPEEIELLYDKIQPSFKLEFLLPGKEYVLNPALELVH